MKLPEIATAPQDLDALLDLPMLISTARALIGDSPMSSAELDVANSLSTKVPRNLVALVKTAIKSGTDPLGTAYCIIKLPDQRRESGQTFTPIEAVIGMFKWATARGEVARIVDPGAGSGRYVLAGLRRIPGALGVASEMDPLLALLLRANANVLGVQDRLTIHLGDFRSLTLEPIEGRTLFIGNPPYVRHHDITPIWKDWYSQSLKKLGHASSQLAGLHLHFFLKTLSLSRPGDLGCFITASEWLDVNYGQSLRDLMTNGLGGKAVFVVSPRIPVFGDALVTACITCFEPGREDDAIEFKNIDNIEQLSDLSGGHFVNRLTAKAEKSWGVLLRNHEIVQPEGFIDLGQLFKVSRGQVTGKNSVWVASSNRFGLPDEFLVPSITEATDIIRAPNARIENLASLRRVIDLPAILDNLSDDHQRAIREFLLWARSEKADQGYIAQHRTPWWRVNMKEAPPIVVTYMGRRPPVFAINTAGARLINVAHGLYPKIQISPSSTANLVNWLNNNVSQDSGRVYAGGLTKFEPSEIMRLKVPSVEMLEAGLV